MPTLLAAEGGVLVPADAATIAASLAALGHHGLADLSEGAVAAVAEHHWERALERLWRATQGV